MYKNLGFSVLCLLVVACGPNTNFAPVEEFKNNNFHNYKSPTTHIVTRKETLYAIAFRYDKDYRSLAILNNIPPPYTLKTGQKIYLTRNYTRKTHNIVNKAKLISNSTRYYKYQAYDNNASWSWPVKGRILSTYAPLFGRKGIEIAAYNKAKIKAAKAGVVAYAGNGLAGYGNLIIIKHDNEFLTAYGNNSKNLVSEGQKIYKGQVIAEMGMINRRNYALHFEIRRSGKPVNPMLFLGK